MRTINIVIGSKAYFQEQIKDFSDAVAFLDLIKLSDSYLGKKQVFPDELKAKLMILRNDNSFGNKMKVTSPKKVVDKIKSALQSALEQYE